jgi:3-oxoacyl-[acyl-carrier protein] reductase
MTGAGRGGADLDGQVALVTGAGGGGGGTTIAAALSARGAHVVVNGLERHRSALERICESDKVSLAIADISVPEQVASLVGSTVGTYGRIDIMVHNAAGSLPYQSVSDLSTAAWHEDLATILDGAFYLSREVAPHMRRNRYGRLIFVSSCAAFRGARGRSAGYSAAKAGLHGLVAHLALELGNFGITANAVAPSQLDTARIRRGGRRTDTSLKAYARSVPVGRAGKAEDLAGVVSFVASADSGYLTGQVLVLDGGSALAPAAATEPAAVGRAGQS